MKTKLIPITSLDQLKVGDIVHSWNCLRKILDITPHLVALSCSEDKKSFGLHYTLHDLTEYQLQVTDEPWKPKEGEEYFYPNCSIGKADASYTDFMAKDIADQARLAAGMCFKTEAEAVAAAQKMLDAIKPN